MQPGLNSHHKRSLVAALSLIDQMMKETLREINQESGEIFTHFIHKPEPKERVVLEKKIAAVRDYLKILRDKYKLDPAPKDIQWMIKVRKSKSLELITDLSPQRLKAGGYLSPEVAETLSLDLVELC
ncbi:MAG: hypothetical protein ACP5O2_08150 [Bacteroidales bacterium]